MKQNKKIPLPCYNNGPVGNYYREINWENGFENWDLIRIDTIADGSCLFHAIANSFFVPYHTEIVDGNKTTRKEIIQKMRKELSESLSSPISSSPNSKTHYQVINSGNTANFPICLDSPEYNFSLENMKKQLNSNNYIGYGYIEFISNVLGKNIYILNHSTQDLYPFEKTELLNIYRKNRPSIVVYYEPKHYELVGIMNNGIVDTYFDSNHTFIKFLYNKVIERSK
jgi:hypothetical protein